MAEEMNGFTAFALLFGDHIDLAKRCLGSILNSLDPKLVCSVRVALNQCSEETRQYVYDKLQKCPVQALVYDSPVNRLKYPMMRKMFYDIFNPVLTQYMMWFDDDSAIIRNDPWWRDVYIKMESSDMLGAIYTMRMVGDQAKAIAAQPWFGNKPMGNPPKFRFATGGWWCARTRIIQRWDYPFKAIVHNGGDTMLGELMRQQDYRLNDFREGLWINADEHGNESKAPRRGEIRKPVWYEYRPNNRVDHSHHVFAESVTAVDPRKLPDDDSLFARLRPGFIRIHGL